ncbi:hypothetical protein EYC80_006813 [Monilinia laxa]|uniref:Uncharacterized protein n=1 Tax=Monilinia laxa TaxID=61186 RepID=A0A5N6JZP7_MONLA|nr:hypothetical protein EYC80_006813 [Monilinia laxa]
MGLKPWRHPTKSWRTPPRLERKEKNVKPCLKADRRDTILLIILLRYRITPPVPYIMITDIILSVSPGTYQDVCCKTCNLEGLTEKQQYYWFAWWCKEMEKKEIMKGGGRWVAAVNWETERVREVFNCIESQLQGRGPVFELVGDEGINKLKLQVGQKKKLIKQKREFMEQTAEQNRILKKREDFIRAKENQSTLQRNWFANNDWRHGSVPDLTILKPKSIIGQGYPFDDFLRSFHEDALTWNSDFDMAGTISANSSHSSFSNQITWSNSSTTTYSTLPLWCADERNTVLKMIEGYRATKSCKKAMRNYLVEMDQAEKEGRPTQWNTPNSSVKIFLRFGKYTLENGLL